MSHCWKSNVEWAEETYGYCSDEHADAMNNTSTCLLPDGHDGPHEFVPDDEIGISFAGAGSEEVGPMGL